MNKGPDYHKLFQTNSRRRILWELERAFLQSIIKAYFEQKEIFHLDFACGTGRIIGYLSQFTKESIGIDVSESMLSVAKETVTRNNVKFFQGNPVTSDVLGNRHFNLVTTFRFFPNAEDSLKRQVMGLLVDRLTPDGILIFNNHRNLHCLRNRLIWLLTLGTRGNSGWAHENVLTLLQASGLVISQIGHAGIFPEWETRLAFPRFFVEGVERVHSHSTLLPLLAEDIIYVCRKETVVLSHSLD
jgi:SAM-dependent methyltransferase